MAAPDQISPCSLASEKWKGDHLGRLDVEKASDGSFAWVGCQMI